MKRLLLIVLFSIILLGIICSSTAQSQGNIIQILTFPEGQLGWSAVNKDDSFLVNILSMDEKSWIYWLKNNKVLKKIDNVQHGVPSPDGNYYFYLDLATKYIYVKNNKDVLVGKFKIAESLDSYQWSLDSRYIYICGVGDDITNIYQCNIKNGNKEIIFSQKSYLRPVPVNNPNILYMLKDIGDDNYSIVKYNPESVK